MAGFGRGLPPSPIQNTVHGQNIQIFREISCSLEQFYENPEPMQEGNVYRAHFLRELPVFCHGKNACSCMKHPEGEVKMLLDY